MSGSVFSLPKTLAHSAGVVVPGAQLRFFLSGTSTPTDSYQDITLSTPHAVPVEADSGGIFPVIYLSPYITYRVRLSDSSATQIYQVDNVNVSIDESATYRLKHTAPALIFEETDASANNGKWRIVANGEVWAIQTGDDAESWTTRFSVTRAGVITAPSFTFSGSGSGLTLGPSASLVGGDTTLLISSGENTLFRDGVVTLHLIDTGSSGLFDGYGIYSADGVLSIYAEEEGTPSVTAGLMLDGAIPFFPGHTTTGSAANAFLDSGDGELLRSTSSAQYKRDIRDIEQDESNRFMSLRPVAYKSRIERDGDVEYLGLIAEEVAEIDPRLVHYMNGKPDGVMYDRVTVGLLGIVRQLREEVDELKAIVNKAEH